jgi:hypothetical protein
MLLEFSRRTVPTLQLAPCLYTLSIEPTSNKTKTIDALKLHLFRTYVQTFRGALMMVMNV